MLTQLSIHNFALIDQLSLDFHPKLNILTGETGAGKSIVIDALRIALGSKIQNAQIRAADKECVIEAVFDLTHSDIRQSEVLEGFLSDEPQLIIHRSLRSDGRQKNKINGLNVTIAQLKSVGQLLMDFHGPHDHQLLLSSEYHIQMLDRLIDFKSVLDAYQDLFKQYTAKQRELEKLKTLSVNRDRDLDLLSHQVKELEQVPLDESVYEELVQEQTKINNAERLFQSANELQNYLEDDQTGTSETIRKSFQPMRQLTQVDPATESLQNYLQQMQDLNQQLVADLTDYMQSLSYDERHAEEINTKCDIYDDIKRKYGPSLFDAQSFYEDAKAKCELLSDLEHNDEQLNKQLKELHLKLTAAAEKITQLRTKEAKSLKKVIETELMELGFKHVKFDVKIKRCDFNAIGQDDVCFYISPNAGEDLKPLADIVSSGEAARVMLALKKALVEVDPIGVLIFDEIDAQIGGRLGQITGTKLRDIAQHRQVILITHLPQIASFADVHFKVTKDVQAGHTLTVVQELDQKARIVEIAQMMSGDKHSDISLKHAKDMLETAGR